MKFRLLLCCFSTTFKFQGNSCVKLLVQFLVGFKFVCGRVKYLEILKCFCCCSLVYLCDKNFEIISQTIKGIHWLSIF